MSLFTKFRTDHELGQTEMAMLLGIKNARLSHYETKRRPVPVDVASKFIHVAASYGDSYTLDDVYEEELRESA